MAGYVHAQPRADFFAKMDATNVDLKAFTEEFYWKHTAAHLAPILDTLKYIAKETSTWLKITTLLIPRHNDSDGEIEALTKWIARELGTHVPLHFSAFHPDYRMMDVPPTPASTLTRVRQIGLSNGLRYVYTGNVHDTEGGTTSCPTCGSAVITRDWYRILEYRPDEQGKCKACGGAIKGRFGSQVGTFGLRRIPVLVDV